MNPLTISFSEQARRSSLHEVGQEDLWEPIWREIPPSTATPLAFAVSMCFPRRMIVAYEHVQMRWLKRDADGNMVAKYPEREAA